ncbi:MAG: dNTP triphosphohydrolase [bacterium]|nr:dNTP triphosphohydrolase [bacterium]
MSSRQDRLRQSSVGDPREPFQRDRDRVLYSAEFRRLSGVTQVASAGEGDVFHNRLTHSLKVAQVGRRLAERLLKDDEGQAASGSDLDPDVVETAGLAHDLGHPPFGHDGEEVIRQAVDPDDSDGFEGNGQSFRIVTRLAAHADNSPDRDDDSTIHGNAGLNLTRATLNAILKYPWFRHGSEDHPDKWGAYRVDEDRFTWVRSGQNDRQLTLEAELMNWADDVTYAVHDLEDFYRAGLIPLHRLLHQAEQDRFIEAAQKRKKSLREQEGLGRALRTVLGPMRLLDGPYDGGQRQRTIMNEAASSLITQFITEDAIRLCDPSEGRRVKIDPSIRLQVDLLKEVTYYYVISHPRLVSVREGQRAMVRKLFDIYLEVLEEKRNQALLPQATRDRLEDGDGPHRLAADLLAAMTERQVIQTYQRFTGIISTPTAYFDF